MRNFFLHFLSNLRKQIPYFASVIGAGIGTLIAISSNIQVEAAVIGLAVVGFIAGMLIKRVVPNPETRAI